MQFDVGLPEGIVAGSQDFGLLWTTQVFSFPCPALEPMCSG